MSASQFRAARAGSASAIQNLTLLRGANESHFRKFLPIIFHHLEVEIPPSEIALAEHTKNGGMVSDFVPEHRFQLIVSCFGGLVGAISNVSTDTARKLLLTPKWSSLREWFRTMVMLLMESEASILKYTNPICDMLIELLVATRDSILGTNDLPGHGILALRLWLYMKRFQLPTRRSFRKALSSPRRHDNTDREFVAVFVEIPDATEILLGEMRRAFKGTGTDWDEEDLYAPIELLFSIFSDNCDRKPPITLVRNRFVSAGIIPTLIDVMFFMTSAGRSSSAHRQNLTGVFSLAMMGLAAVMSYIGPRSVHQALRHNLLATMIAAAPLFEPRHVTTLANYCDFLSSLSCLWIQPYILREGKRRLDLDFLSAFIASLDPGSKIHQSWTRFQEIFLFYRNLRHRYKLTGHHACSNPNCSAGPISLTRLKRCQGCCSAHYCSRQCQKIDWKLAHRDKCNPPPAIYSYQTVPKIQADYVSWCLGQRAYNSLCAIPGAKDLLASKRGRYPAVFQFEYSFTPVSISRMFIMSGEEALDLWKDEKFEEFRALIRDKSPDQDGVIVCAMIADVDKQCPTAIWYGQITSPDVGKSDARE
ncbi:hypothetical protein C8J56DRAFT_1165187 [Mycena floridula]|nr:hypothetical protein C8J56DRAFT_1165187 [Mycena floridula]